MNDIGTAYVKIAPNMTGIQQKIAAGMKGAGGTATKQLGDEVDSNSGPFQKAIGKLGGIAKTGGLAIAGGIAAGAAGMAALTAKSLMAGAELEQQLGGAEAVFGKYASRIIATADDAYTEMGLSQNEFLQGANKMGSLFQGAGFTVEKSMQMSISSMQRASDVASIMGIDTTAALEAVTGMAKGNFTMMDNLGVAMNDTAINAFAVEKEFNNLSKGMTTQQKVGLAHQLFLEKTAKYAGNYAKENETLGGSLNTTKKAFQDFMATGNITGFMNSLVKTIEIAVPQILAILPKLVTGISTVLTGLVPSLSSALPVLLPALIDAVKGLLSALVSAMPGIVKVLVGALPSIIDAFIQIFLAVVKALPEIIKILSEAMPQIIDSLVNGLTNPEALTAIIEGAVLLFLAIVQATYIVIPAIIRAIPTIVQNIVNTLTNPQFIRMMIGAGVELIKAMITGLFQMYSAVGTASLQILSTMRKFLSWETMRNVGGEMIKGLWQGISDLAGWIMSKIKGFSGDILGGIKGFFGIKSPSTVFAGIGHDLNRGLAKGITSTAGLVTKSVNDMSNQALAAMGVSDISASYSVGSSVGSLPAGNTTNSQSVQIGQVMLGDAGAVKEFFKQLSQDSVSAGMGITPVQGATS